MEINDPRIEAYLNGEMTPEEIVAFEAEANNRPKHGSIFSFNST